MYLTVTLPPVPQSAFLIVAGHGTRELEIIRAESITRANIAYQVQEYTQGKLDRLLVKLIAGKRTNSGPGTQPLIYCPSVGETKRLGKVL